MLYTALDPSRFLAHYLELNFETSVILLQNLNSPNLCNGTRLQIKMKNNSIIVAVISMIPTDLSFQYKHLKFPVKLSYSITIIKLQR